MGRECSRAIIALRAATSSGRALGANHAKPLSTSPDNSCLINQTLNSILKISVI